MLNQRNNTIDMLRGIAVLAMIIIHVNAHFLSDKLAYNIWNYSQFAVPIFVFCSAYLFFSQLKRKHVAYDLSYFKKRLLRLFVPYWIFLLFYLSFLFVVDAKLITVPFIIQNIFAIGGVDLNWLVLLFTYFTFLMPLIGIIKSKHVVLFYLLGIISLLSSIFFLIAPTPIPYKLIMWLPWLVVIMFSALFVDYEDKKFTFIIVLGLSFVVCVSSWLTRNNLQLPLDHVSNKYPPNVYHLSYGIFCTMLLYWLAHRNIFSKFRIDSMINFLSLYSYSLYFIHFFFVLIFLKLNILKPLGWQLGCVVILSLAVMVQLMMNQLLSWRKS